MIFMLTPQDLENLGKVIEGRMAEMGINASELERLTGEEVSRQYIGSILSGFKKEIAKGKQPKDIGPSVLFALADALKIPRAEILLAAGYRLDTGDTREIVKAQVNNSEQYWVLRIKKSALGIEDFFRLERVARGFVLGVQYERAADDLRKAGAGNDTGGNLGGGQAQGGALPESKGNTGNLAGRLGASASAAVRLNFPLNENHFIIR